MTINKLHKILSKLIEQGAGRRPVCIDKTKVTHPLENDGVCIIPITSCEVECIEIIDENGSTKYDSKGYGVVRTMCVIKAQN